MSNLPILRETSLLAGFWTDSFQSTYLHFGKTRDTGNSFLIVRILKDVKTMLMVLCDKTFSYNNVVIFSSKHLSYWKSHTVRGIDASTSKRHFDFTLIIHLEISFFRHFTFEHCLLFRHYHRLDWDSFLSYIIVIVMEPGKVCRCESKRRARGFNCRNENRSDLLYWQIQKFIDTIGSDQDAKRPTPRRLLVNLMLMHLKGLVGLQWQIYLFVFKDSCKLKDTSLNKNRLLVVCPSNVNSV